MKIKKIMRVIVMIVVSFYVTLPSFAGESVSLAWNPSPDSSVTGYRVYSGIKTGTYTNAVDVGNKTNATIVGLQEGVTYYFAATAYDAAGLESEFSNEVAYTPPPTPLVLDSTYTASAGCTLDRTSGLISGNVPTLPAEAKSVYWAKGGLNVTAGQILTLSGNMYYNGDGVISVYLADKATGVWLSPERVINLNSSYGYCQTYLIVRGSSTNATLYVTFGLLPGLYEFQRTDIALTTPAVKPVTSLYLKQLLSSQVVGNLYSAEWLWSPATGSQGYVVRTALTRDDIEREIGVLLSEKLLTAGQTTYRCDINATLYSGIYVAVSSIAGGQESVPWITWYLPGDVFNTADEYIPPLCFQGSVDTNDVNYSYTGYKSSRRTPIPTSGWPAGREERTDIDQNAYAGRVSDYSFIRSQYLNGRRMQ